MKIAVFLLSLIIGGTAFGQQQPYQIPGQPQNIQFFGSSTAEYGYEYESYTLVNISSSNFYPPLYYNSERCANLLNVVQTIPLATTVVLLEGVGVVDVENRADGTRPSTPVNVFMGCAVTLTTAILNRCTCSIWWTDVNPFNIAATDVDGNNGPYTDPRATLTQYNQAMTAPGTGIVAQFPGKPVYMVLIHDQLSDTNGWAMDNYVSWTDPLQAAWPIIFQQTIGAGLYTVISGNQYY
jgi:hypothetical protein